MMIAIGVVDEEEEAKRRARSDDHDSSSSSSRGRDRGHRSGDRHHQSSSSEKTRTTTSSRSGTTTIFPGTDDSASSSNEKNKSKDSNRKAHCSPQEISPTRPGAQRSSPRTSNIDQDQPSVWPTTSTTSIDGEEVLAQAVLVEDDDSGDDETNQINDTNNNVHHQRMEEVEEEENLQFRRRMQQENEGHQRNQMEQENELSIRRLEMEDELVIKKRVEQKKRNRRRCVAVVVLVVLIIGGGIIGAYFGTRRSSSSDPSTVAQAPVATDNPNNGPSLAPVVAPGNDGGNTTPTVPVTPFPSASPSDAPTEPLKYPPPNIQDCENVAIGLPRDEPNGVDLITTSYQLTLDVESSSSNLQSLIPSLESQMQRILVLELVGCNDIVTRRFLRRRNWQGDIRYVVFNAKVAVLVAEGKTCQDSSITASPSNNCSVVQVNLDLSLQGQEFGFLITNMIFDVFDTSKDPNHDNLASKLELPQTQFQSISFNSSILPLDPTGAPSKSPTNLPSTSPTTGRPSATPTRMPSGNPTNSPTGRPNSTTAPEPTRDPTHKETPKPTPEPPPPPGPVNNDNCEEDIPSYFEGGEYDEYVGGLNSVYILQCDDLIGTNVIGFSVVDENGGCGFTCVADKKPKDFEPKCGNAPPGTTVEIILKGNFEGERILIGIQADGVPKLPCEDPFLVEALDF